MRININERLTDERLEGMRISNVCGGKDTHTVGSRGGTSPLM